MELEEIQEQIDILNELLRDILNLIYRLQTYLLINIRYE